ncbi:hypothetical protein KC19_5G128400 [Ceratodon purpureus]|uniref:AMP deaminase n=1 Tax=Ceratodon purpureus TaxID=3225 RepID=A0A8T0I3E6_CERPU|nr:hypothetical protein KC19_5G128400 [Ceratodon purpureus]
MENSSRANATWLSLVVAAMVGATVAGASSYMLHWRALDRLQSQRMLDSTDTRRARRGRRKGLSNRVDSVQIGSTTPGGSELMASDNAINSSLPPSKAEPYDSMSTIPPGLPRVQTRKEGGTQPVGSTRRPPTPLKPASKIRPSSPKSPVQGNGSYESVEGSEEEDHLLPSEDENVYNEEQDEDEDTLIVDGERNGGSELVDGLVKPQSPKSENAVLKSAAEKSAASMIRSHSINGDMHCVHAPDPIAADILRKEPEQETYVKLNVTPIEAPSEEEEEVCRLMHECLLLRDKYLYREKIPPWVQEEITDPSTPKANPNPFKYHAEPASSHAYKMVDGVYRVYADKETSEELYKVHDATSFFTDMHRILRIVSLGNVRTLCHHRLKLLEQKFSLHLMLNADREFLAQKSAPHRDFYNVRKVDTHVHHSSCMNQKHLLRFIKSKLRRDGSKVVIFRDGKYLTLKQVFESLDLTGYDLNVDLLDVHADKNTFHRFDKFNLKYNPFGQSRLREIFLKQDNHIEGKFLAELTQQVFSDLKASKYQMAEYRISIYGRKQSEWDQLANWIVDNELHSENVTWLIQLPRLYSVYKEMGIVQSFETVLENVFAPLFEVTVDPSSHPKLHVLLTMVVGFDMVDDESKPERRPTKHMQPPAKWDNPFNPAYSYWAYYVYANLYTLNKLRESKGFPTIKFRPHTGEAGDLDHLAASFLVAHNIAHGNNLRKTPGLQYLYYLAQIGLAMSPLSNNSLFLDYHRNPFPMFFSRGLNVSLSTDDPLQIHLTKEPLVEEYSIAAQVWKLSSCDLCEIARNSVYQSGFHHRTKSHWLGKNYYLRGPDGNDIHKTNVPHMRVEFRHEVWLQELDYVTLGKARVSSVIEPHALL